MYSENQDEEQLDEEINLSRLKNTWDSFFQKYDYYKELGRLTSHYPEEKSIYVSYNNLEEFDGEFAREILENPVEVISAGEKKIKEYSKIEKESIIGREKDSVKINLRIIDLPEDIKFEIRNIRSPEVGKLISVTGIIRKNTEVLPRILNACFECSVCGHHFYISQGKGRVEEPTRCPSEKCGLEKGKTRFKLITSDSVFVDTQKIEIQENPENLGGGAQPLRMAAILEDDISGKLFPGDRVTLDGILMADQKMNAGTPLTEFSIYLKSLNYRKTDKELDEIHITDEDEEQIHELSRNPKIMDMLISSIAPTIFGLEKIKQALVLQMFGGVRKVMKDGTAMRGDIHILLVGDPGTAKSQLLRYMTEISPRGVFAFGRGSSSAGLTAAAVRDEFGEGRWTLEAGALVLADNGFVAIDEMDKMDDKDTASMHEAMEQQTVTISKAGIMATLKSRCAVLAAANPKGGRYRPELDFMEQVNFPPPLISRFDVIFKLMDKPNREGDLRLAEHVLRAHRIGEGYRSTENRGVDDEILQDAALFEPPIGKEMLRKYVGYSKSRIFPKLSDEAIAVLRDEYVNTRSSGEKKNSIPITARQLESTIRLAEAAARARLSAIVSIDDAIQAKKIVDYFLYDVSAADGHIDIDLLMTGMSSVQRTDIELISEIISELKRSNKGSPMEENVISEALTRGLKDPEIKKAIAKGKSMGIFYSPYAKRIDLV
ncbi:MAG: minichromosome maintenance protein MCM [Thermoplasmataceae archaeon]